MRVISTDISLKRNLLLDYVDRVVDMLKGTKAWYTPCVEGGRSRTGAIGMSSPNQSETRLFRFGVFEVDLGARELRKRGVRVKLQDQPFRVLEALLEKSGEIVTREELKDRLWAQDEFVEFDKSLNTAVQKIRQALGDSAESPQFLDTVPRVGYRFVAALQKVERSNDASPEEADNLRTDTVGSKRRLQTLYGLAAVLGVALLGLAYAYLAVPETGTPPATVTRFSLAPEGLVRARISPDGKYILYVAEVDGRRSLGLRSLSDESTSELPGTEGAMDGFWSPDSAWIGFGTNAELKKVSIEGGSPITLSELPHNSSVLALLGGTWSPDGERIVFSSGLQLYEVASSGGEPRLLFDASEDPRPGAVHPHFLPAGRGPAALVYAAGPTAQDNWLLVFNMETNERRELGPGSMPIYSQNGYLIQGPRSQSDPGLWALPFSLRTLESTEDPFPISTTGSGASLARNGTLAYVERSVRSSLHTLIWRNRAGKKLETVGQPLEMVGPALSPDGQRVAVGSLGGENRDIWIHDLARSTKTRLTFEDQTESNPAWSPSGRELVYRLTGSPERIIRRAADGTGEAVTLVEADVPVYDPEWSRDGRYVLYHQRNSETQRDIRYIELGADGMAGEPITLLDSRGNEWQPRLSPDGRFLAYVSDESGRDEVYVRRFPSGEGKWHASTNGGVRPRWRSDGKELYYVEGDTLMAVSVSTESALTLGLPQSLFATPNLDPIRSPAQPGGYDVSADGQRFLTMGPAETDGEETARSSIRVVMNWYEEFRDRD